MLTEDTQALIRSRVARVTGIPLPCTITAGDSVDLTVTLASGHAHIGCDGPNSFARGCFLLTRCLKEGQAACDIHQTRHFASCGVMADMSRNAVLTLDGVRRLIDQLAALGMNLLMLYTEDTYEVPGYPYMGHLRGRYSLTDLRALDDYAAEMGVELVPCIQTLGHMAQFLQWADSDALRDQPDILLIDDDAAFRFVEAEIAAVSGCFRSRRIHIGMDEAHGVGLGQYYLKHGPTDRFALLSRHLRRVVDACAARGMKPIMWSDMFFRLGSKTNDYYDLDAEIPAAVRTAIPEVSLCYWDYYHHDEAFYDKMLTLHEELHAGTVFAGGIWTWSGFLPQVKRTEDTMLPALRACAVHHVDTVLATLWGDDGAETNLFLASSRLPMFSEACWQGADCPMAEIQQCGECLTGLADEAFRAMGEFYPTADETWSGKQVIWCDPLYPLMHHDGEDWDAIIRAWRQAEEVVTRYPDREDCRYAALLFRLGQDKSALLRDLRTRYLAGDKAYLAKTAEETIPRLTSLYDELMRAHRHLWERDMKRFGWEVLSLRYGGVIGRLADVQDELRRYLTGDLPCIPELEEAPLDVGRESRQTFHSLVTPSVIL